MQQARRLSQNALLRYWFTEKGDVMKPNEITPETIMEMGKMWGDLILSSLPLEERLKGLKPEEMLSQYKTEEVLAQYKPEEIEAYLRKIKQTH